MKELMIEPKKKHLKLLWTKLKKIFGKGTIMRLGDAPKVNIESISTGAMNLDIALGIGGIPKGRIIENLRTGHQVKRHLLCI